MATPAIPLTVTADQAEQGARRMMREMNQQRSIPVLPASIAKLAEEQTVHIFNVGPWEHKTELGSINGMVPGRFIPKYDKNNDPEGIGYSAAKPIPGIVAEPVIIDEKHMELRQEEGRYVAEQIVGIGKHLAPSNSLLKYGVFVAAGKTPTKKELLKARERLQEYYVELVTEARSAYARGPKEAEAVIRPELHHLAARELGLHNEPWLVQMNPEANAPCPACGTMLTSKVVLCPNCKFIINQDAYVKMSGQFAK